MGAKIMIVGLGDLGAVLLELLLRVPRRNGSRGGHPEHPSGAKRSNLARLGALAQGCTSEVRLIELDLNCMEATAAAIHREQPAIVITTATMATWWLPNLLPPEDAEAIRRAGFGVWLPYISRLRVRPMRAVREAKYSGLVLTAPYPDVVNHVLGKVGLAPTCGIGNVAEMVPKVRAACGACAGVSVARVQAVLVAHHALGRYVYSNSYPGQDDPVPPFLLRIECDGQDVTGHLNVRELVLSPEPIPEGQVTHLLTAGSSHPSDQRFAAGTFLHFSMPPALSVSLADIRCTPAVLVW